MNGMKLRCLDEVSKPFGRPDVGMVEVFARSAEEVVPKSPHHGTSQQRIQHQCAENGIAQYLNGMLVKRRQYFNARRRVMDLVKNQPESFRMPQPMPPVEEERADESAHEPFRQRHVPGGQLEQRYVAEYLNPEPRSRENNQQLRQIDQQRPAIPPFRVRQCTAGERSFQDKKENRGNKSPLCLEASWNRSLGGPSSDIVITKYIRKR